MKLSFSTLGCPDWSQERIAEQAAALGFDGVELRTHTDGNHLSPDAPPAEIARVRALFAARGTRVMSVKGYSRFALVDDGEVAANQALLRRLVAIAEGLGARYVRTFAGEVPRGADPQAMLDRVAAAIRPVAREAAARGVRIALETHDDWCAGAVVARLAESVASPDGFGIVYDVFNAIHGSKEPWERTYAAVRPHLCYCHIKDGYVDAQGKIQYVMVGAGELPLRALMARLKRDAYDGFLSLEWEKKWHPEIEGPERAFPPYPRKMRAVWNDVGGAEAAAG